MIKKILAGILAGTALFAASAKSAPKVSLKEGNEKAQPYATIQAALDAIGTKSGDFTITLPKGTYPEALYYNGPANITIKGAKSKYGKSSVIALDNSGDILRLKKASSAQKNRCLVEFEGSGNIVFENITLHNTFERGSVKGSNTQAEAFGYDGTGTVAAYNCSFISHQDTIRTTGKTWFYKCHIEGDTDFLWMEATGKVALFEECEIVSVFDKNASNHTSYVCAPRMNIGDRADKGIVILNSTITTQEGQNTYLARTPWSNGYLNQVAYINTKADGIDSDIWYGKCLTATGVPQNVIGWKLDSKTAANLKTDTAGRNDVLSDSDAEKEFGGRRAILNRFYDGVSNKYKKDSEFFWDVDSLIKSAGWKVSEDKSKALLDGEKESVKKVYVLDGSQEYPDLVCDGFAQEKGKAHFQGASGATIKFKVPGKALVTVTGYYAGSGTIKAGNQGAAAYSFNNGSTNKTIEKSYVVYEDNAEVTITAEEKSYITKISVESDDTLAFVPVESISVSAEDNATELPGKRSLQMKAVLNPGKPTNSDYVWSVSDENAASIDSNGVLKANSVAADTTITVKATARDEKAASGEIKIKILKPEAGAFAASWLDSAEHASSYEGTLDNEEVVSIGKCVPSKGTWKFNSSKVTPALAKGALSYSGYSSPIKEGEVYIDFPITAKEKIQLTDVTVAFGNHGTGNAGALITIQRDGKDVEDIVDDSSRTIRSAKKSYEIEPAFVVEKGQTVSVRVMLYGTNGDIPTGKAPTIGTITVSGKMVK